MSLRNLLKDLKGLSGLMTEKIFGDSRFREYVDIISGSCRIRRTFFDKWKEYGDIEDAYRLMRERGLMTETDIGLIRKKYEELGGSHE
jgi:hypothetical protein